MGEVVTSPPQVLIVPGVGVVPVILILFKVLIQKAFIQIKWNFLTLFPYTLHAIILGLRTQRMTGNNILYCFALYV